MGCDIHMHVEYKRTVNGQTRWMCGDYFKVNPYFEEFPNENPFSLVRFCDDRNYNRFATLANVRNYENLPYIDKPRGLPADVTKEVKADVDYWGDDGHSHSYFTLKELIDFQKNAPPLRFSGMISPEAQKALDETGKTPDAWYQWTNEKGWARREWTDENTLLVPLIKAIKQRADELYVIHDGLWDHAPEKAYELSDEIRIVFWFDN